MGFKIWNTLDLCGQEHLCFQLDPFFFFPPTVSSEDGFSYPRNKNFAKRKSEIAAGT